MPEFLSSKCVLYTYDPYYQEGPVPLSCFERADAPINMTGSPTAQSVDVSEGLTLLLVSFMSIAIYNGLELFFWIFDFFKRRHGCYFWSMVISAFGIINFALAQVLIFFNLAPKIVWAPSISISYLTMSTALIMVLYSRLHLVTSDRIARWALYMIIVTTLVFPVPMQILFLVGIFKQSMRVLDISLIYERLVVTVSCAREYLILAIYNFEAFRNLKYVIAIKGPQGRKVRRILIATTFIIVCLDTALLVTEFQDRRAITMTYSAFSVSIKLKMEFAILNKLINLVQSPANPTGPLSDPPSSDQHPIHPHPQAAQSQSPSRVHSLAHSWNPFRCGDAKTSNSRVENSLFAEESGLGGGTGLTRPATLDEYHASGNARTSSWDELVQQPSMEISSGPGGKGTAVVSQESKEPLRPVSE
ncbi:uncharacterized protein KD926_004403 [Aspergillus affinis]|uniref:uncharacterized protein n=1 Tax=Aspergillus affinis TaxID=1070780 RepID=UPI0022FE4F3B|nr:uncharacterized protein KD926_004403 [Aspergillus affinis]KAI9043219.1 hypothetical protein KD926_004403 [Aspergillus affinis]